VYVLQPFEQRVNESMRATKCSRVDSALAFTTKDQRNAKFGGPVPKRLLIGAQDPCESLEANASDRLLPDQCIV